MSSSSSSPDPITSGPYGVKVSRRVSDGVDNTTAFFRLQLQAHDAQNMPNAIFRYAVTGKNAGGEFTLEFDGVCTPMDLEQWAESAPGTDVSQFPNFVRSDKGDLVYPTADFLADAWTTLLAEVTQLVEDLDKLDDLDDATTATFGETTTNAGPGDWWT